MSWIRDLVGRSLLAALLVAASLFVGVVPTAAAEAPEEVAICEVWFGGDHCHAPTDDELRERWVRSLMDALESYGAANGTFKIPNSGFDGRGTGWAVWEGNRYSISIASRLSAEGFLPALEISDSWDQTTALAASEGIALVYRCKDRVAVFNVGSSEHATASDSDWWTNNGCFRYPIDQLGATYYVVSRPLSDLDGEDYREALRLRTASELLDALTRYGKFDNTYKVPYSGFDARGTGWAFYEGDRYDTSIADYLMSSGFLYGYFDPTYWAETVAMASTEGAVSVHRCKDRVAVFTRHRTAQPSSSDADWWADNDCTRYPIDQLGATYFQVSIPLCPGCYDDDIIIFI